MNRYTQYILQYYSTKLIAKHVILKLFQGFLNQFTSYWEQENLDGLLLKTVAHIFLQCCRI